MFALAHGLVPKEPLIEDSALKVHLWGYEFRNPVGLAAGLDNDAQILDRIFDYGFGFMEAGTVTPRPQQGNLGRWMYRLVNDAAVINQVGFHSVGLEVFSERILNRLTAKNRLPGIVGANIGKNRDSEEAAIDYTRCINRLSGLVDYIVINVSSPNTPKLRDLQASVKLDALIQNCVNARNAQAQRAYTPLLVKISPDLNDREIEDISVVCLKRQVDGIIVSNTTTQRPDTLISKYKDATGGLSGKPLFLLSTNVLGKMYQLTGGRIPLVGVGGVFSAADAYEKIRSGASLVQIHTGFVYGGPELITEINSDLIGLLKKEGFTNVMQAVGSKFGAIENSKSLRPGANGRIGLPEEGHQGNVRRAAGE